MNNKSSYKRILGVIVSVIFVFSGVISALVMYYDPFFHYHAPSEGGKYIFDNEVYQNPGIARNFDYDSVIVGSSMTRPLSPSEFDEQYDCKSVQMPFSGGSVKNASINVEQAFHHKGSLKYVFWGIDPYGIDMGVDETKIDLPTYIYDDNPLNDLAYLLNKEVVKKIYDDNKYGSQIIYDEMWNDEADEIFCKMSAIGGNKLITDNVGKPAPKLNFDESYTNIMVEENLNNNIIPLVKEHPKTQFVFFVPPYPVIFWNIHGYLDEKKMDEQINTFIQFYNRIKEYDNAEFHLLPIMEETGNLYMYKDSWHYNRRLGNEVPKALVSNKYIVTDNYAVFDEFCKYIFEYDYRIYTSEIYSFQNETGFDSYLEMIMDDRFAKIVLISPEIGDLSINEINALKKYGLVDNEYLIGNYYNIVNEEGVDLSGLRYCFETKETGEKASVTIDDIEYNAVPKLCTIVVIDKETKKVVDVAGLRDDTRTFEKY